jgi:predicted transposase/invertase (TIGR01784 family)
MVLGIDPKVDYAFKWLLGREDHTSILINLLHSILKPSPDEQITELQILNPFTDKPRVDDKLSILDIRARDALGRQFNIEMQMVATGSLGKRILYYWSKLYSAQLLSGARYDLLRPTISVCFVNGVLFPAVQENHLEFRLTEKSLGISLTDDLAIHFFELPKFRLTAEELVTPLDTWLYFLRYAENLDPEALPEHMNTAEIRQAMEALEVISHVDLRKEMYEDRIKAVMDERSRLADSHSSGISIGREEGISIGREEGISIGRNIGREEGVSIGREEGEKEGERKGSLNAVPILLELGASVERIAEALNLDVDEVRQVAASS